MLRKLSIPIMAFTNIDAKDLRVDIDSNSDGIVSSLEAEDFESALEQPQEKHIFFDEKTYYKIEVDVEVKGAEGDINSNETITITGAGLQYFNVDKSKSTHEYKRTETEANIEYSYKVPVGWTITEVSGLDDKQISSDGRQVTGVTAGGNLKIELHGEPTEKSKDDSEDKGFLPGFELFIFLVGYFIVFVFKRRKGII
jgi:hypothetical protein